jgi:hypothetical protein
MRRGSIGLLLCISLPARAAAPTSEAPAATPVLEVLDVEDTRTGSEHLSKEALMQLTRYVSARIMEGDQFAILPTGPAKAALEAARKRHPTDSPSTTSPTKLLETTVFKFASQCAVSATLFDLATGVGEQSVLERASCDADAILKAADRAATTLGAVDQEAAGTETASKSPDLRGLSQAQMSKVLERANLCPSFGYVTVDTRPWSEVYLNGVRLGQTPLVKQKLPIGWVEVRAVNPVNRKERTFTLKVRPDKPLRYKLEL